MGAAAMAARFVNTQVVNVMAKASLLAELEAAAAEEPVMFHPIHQRSEKAWCPSNEPACVLSLIAHTWEDLMIIGEIRAKTEGEREKRLLFKYALIELHSIVGQFERLQSLIFQTIRSRQKEKCCYISEREIVELKGLLKQYHSVKRLVERDLIEIRNNIGAHRGYHPWNEIVALWDKIDPEQFRPLLETIPTLFECVRKLDIYDWMCIPEKGTVEICCSGLKDLEPW